VRPEAWTKAQVEDGLADLERQGLGFTFHDIYLGQGVYTMSGREVSKDPVFAARLASHGDALNQIVHATAYLTKKPVSQLRVLDLACAEGQFTLEFGRMGCERCVGVEVRSQHVTKCNFAKQAMGLDNVEFVVGDVNDVDVSTFGRFDVILCLGLMYHLSWPSIIRILENIRGTLAEDGVFFLETIASSREGYHEEFHDGVEYPGSSGREFDPAATSKEVLAGEKSVTDTRLNKGSFGSVVHRVFIPTRDSFLSLLTNLGFTYVSEIHTPQSPNGRRKGRMMLACKVDPLHELLTLPRFKNHPLRRPSLHQKQTMTWKAKRVLRRVGATWRRVKGQKDR